MSLLLSVAATVVVLASLLPETRDSTGALELMRTASALVLADDREGTAILQADGLRPGSQVSGEVTLRN